MFSGPVKPSSEAEKCSFLLIWVRQKGRDNCYTWSNIIIVSSPDSYLTAVFKECPKQQRNSLQHFTSLPRIMISKTQMT